MAGLLAVIFLALHLPYLPTSLEDLDSINFALGIRHFDVAHHQPHPPGYPVFILLAKTMRLAVPSEATALASVSVVAASLGVLAIVWLFRRLDDPAAAWRWPVTATAMAMTTPLYWFTAVRPLSDSSGLAAAIAVQAMTLAAASPRALAVATFCAGLACGVRSQVLWLTAPLLALRALQGLGIRGWAQSLIPVVSAFASGVLLWFVPLMILSGGPTAYWYALFDQGAEDLGNITMLWNNHGARDVVDALYYALVAPWAAWPLAAVVLACASAGVVRLARDRRRTLTVLAIAFGPYFVFDLLFQETFTGRYALPLIVPIAYLAVAGLRLLPWDAGIAIAVAVAMFSAHVGGTSIAAYSRAPAPAFRLLDAMREAAKPDAVLAMDRRESLDLRRPRQWVDDPTPAEQILKAPPQHEWLEAVRYWNNGGKAPVWFVVDPMRTSIDLVQHGEPQRFRWGLPYPVLLSGVRPNEMDWYRVGQPEWYVGEGWSLTPESAGVAAVDGGGLSRGPIDAWIDGRAVGRLLMIGGRNLEPASPALLSMRLDDSRPFGAVQLLPGPFLDILPLPDGAGRPAYSKLTLSVDGGKHVAIEQFDVSATRPLVGFGGGWHEQEFNPRTGARWRWLSERGELQLRMSSRRPQVTLHIEGESPRKYFARGSRLVVRSGERVVFDEMLSADFSRDVAIANPANALVLETDQTYVPAERSGRTQDRRHLGLRMFKIAVF